MWTLWMTFHRTILLKGDRMMTRELILEQGDVFEKQSLKPGQVGWIIVLEMMFAKTLQINNF